MADGPLVELEEIHNSNVRDTRANQAFFGLVRASSNKQATIRTTVEDELASTRVLVIDEILGGIQEVVKDLPWSHVGTETKRPRANHSQATSEDEHRTSNDSEPHESKCVWDGMGSRFACFP